MVLLLLLALPVHAQTARFDGQVLQPSPDSRAMLWTEDTHTAPDGYATARAFLQYAGAPVRWRGADGETDVLVSDLIGIDALGALRWKTLRLGVDVPIYLFTAGDLDPSQPGLGDLSVDLKGTVLPADVSPVGVALLGRLALPTASVEVPLGANGTGWELMAVVDREQGPFTFAANVGTREVPRAEFEDLVWNDQFLARLGAGYQLADDYGASLELAAQTNWASGENPAGTAAELLGGGWYSITNELVARGGLSFGLTRSPGAPVIRMIAGVSWEPDPNPDQDFDGIGNKDDHCPTDPEDPDGYADDDGCNDRSYSAEFSVVDGSGNPVEATVSLDGPDRDILTPGDRVATVHPGTYQVRADVAGFEPWQGTIEVPPRQGERFTIRVTPAMAHLRLWAYDAAGKPVPAQVRVSGGEAFPADGTDIPLEAGEHAVTVSAEGYVAGSTSLTVGGGELREISVILAPAGPGSPPAPAPPPAPVPPPAPPGQN